MLTFKKIILSFLFVSISFLCYAPPYYAGITFENYAVVYTYKPQTYKDSTIYKLWQYRNVAASYGISPDLYITQAIIEQGYRLNKNNRIFNISCDHDTSLPHELVFDKKTRRWRRHRTYNTLKEAIKDYCRLISTSDFYKEVMEYSVEEGAMQLHAMSQNKHYAENPKYGYYLRLLYCKRISKILSEINESKCKHHKITGACLFKKQHGT